MLGHFINQQNHCAMHSDTVDRRFEKRATAEISEEERGEASISTPSLVKKEEKKLVFSLVRLAAYSPFSFASAFTLHHTVK